MKNLIIAGMIFGTWFGMLSASADEPVLVRHTSAGYVLPEMQFFQNCEIYSNRVVRKRGVQGLSSLETRSIILVQKDLETLITQAGADPTKIIRTPAPTDMGGNSYKGYLPLADGKRKEVVLYDYTQSEFVNNTSPAAQALKLFMDMHCQK